MVITIRVMPSPPEGRRGHVARRKRRGAKAASVGRPAADPPAVPVADVEGAGAVHDHAVRIAGLGRDLGEDAPRRGFALLVDRGAEDQAASPSRTKAGPFETAKPEAISAARSFATCQSRPCGDWWAASGKPADRTEVDRVRRPPHGAGRIL
jgi:hypothetical protein